MYRVIARSVPRGIIQNTVRNKGTWIENYPPRKTNTILNIAPTAQWHIIERLGKFHAIRSGEWYIALPLIDRIRGVLSARDIVIQIEPQHAITKDNVKVDLSCVLFMKIKDPKEAMYKVAQPLFATSKLCESSMRSACGLTTLDNLLHNRQEINKSILSSVSNNTKDWGIEVVGCEITEITPDADVSKSMDKQSISERKRREQVTEAEADSVSARTRSEGESQAIEKIATAKAFAIRADAEARAYSIEKIADTLKTHEGRKSVQVDLAKIYLESLRHLGAKGTTFFLPSNPMNVNSTIATALCVAKSVIEGNKDKEETETKEK